VFNLNHGLNLSTRLTIAIVGLVIATAGTVGFLSYHNIEAIAIPSTLVRLDAHARALAVDLANIASNARADLKAFRHVIGLEEIIARSRDPSIEPADAPTLAVWRARLAQRMAAQLEAKPDYVQFSIIGIADGGREIISVQRRTAGGEVRVVPDAELRRQAERDYFKQTMTAGDGVIAVSPVELKQENGGIESPNVPVVRLSTPIFAPDGTPFGIIVIDVDLRSAFERIAAAAGPGSTVYVVNERGDYLAHPDPSRTFGFAFGTPFRIQDDYPALAQAVVTGQRQPELIEGRDGKRLGVALASVRLADGPRISVVETIPENKIAAAALSAMRDSSLIGGTIAVMCGVLLAFILARTLTRPLTEMTAAVAGFADDAPLLVPLTAGGEIGVLARAFKKMVREVRAKNAAIQRNTELFESIMAEMGEAVLLYDAQGVVVYENRTATAILRPPAGLKRPAWEQAYETFHLDGVTPLAPEKWPSRRCLRGELVSEYELLFRFQGTDTLRRLVGSARPIHDATGTQTGAVVVFRDVTETKETERQLRESQKLEAVGQLTAGVAHDFNNMLTVITGTAEILVEGLADRPALLTIARLIDQAADRGANLTRHLLAFARKQPLQPRNIDINAMVRETAELLRPTLGEQIEIEAMLAKDAEPARIDSSQLSTALLNLALNARDAMPSGGKLTLETSNVVLEETYTQTNPDVRSGAYVLIAVSDTGIGIPVDLRDKVFEPFFTTKAIGKGSGLGLSMVYGFVKQSNGHIKIYSEEGHGTTIKLYLPRATANADAPAAALPAMTGGDETVMVVEDDAMVRNFVVTQLHSLGYKTLTAANGKIALAQLDDGAVFDLLLTDVIMPGGINGRQLADTVNLRRPAVKVLYTSGYTENAIVHHGRLDAGVLLLAKPYRRSDLARMVRTALDGDLSVAGGADAPAPIDASARSSARPLQNRQRAAGA
jgi:signal transduction histidine kinase/FixJ family two-component response regulator/HAMP domain-containing protein